MTFTGVGCVAARALLLITTASGVISAQGPTASPPSSSPPSSRPQSSALRGTPPRRGLVGQSALASLDAWLVTRFRNVQLLEDSSMAAVTVAAPPLSPRVESVRVGSGVDTLYALQVSADAGLPTLRDQSTVRLSGSSGVITTHVARIVARRAFRLPLLPGSGNARARQWRYGWAYATAVTRGTRPALGYRGWVLLATTDSAARR